MTKLPDALLIRDAWMGAGPRQRQYDGHTYLAVSVWADEAGAREAAAAIRAQGRLARVTLEARPWRARPCVQIYSRRPARPQKTNICPPRPDRWMWVVWEGEKPACAGGNEGAPAE